MGFLAVLEKIDQIVADVEKVIEAPLAAFFPPAIPFLKAFDMLQQSIVTAEALYPAPNSGAVKIAAVQQDFNSKLAVTQNALATKGKALSYDPVAWQKANDAQVAAQNAGAELQASFKIVSLQKAT